MAAFEGVGPMLKVGELDISPYAAHGLEVDLLLSHSRLAVKHLTREVGAALRVVVVDMVEVDVRRGHVVVVTHRLVGRCSVVVIQLQ